MTVSKAQSLASQRYRKKTYEQIFFDVKKGIKAEYKAAAAELGMSLAGLLTTAAEEFIQRHGGEVNFPAQTTQPAQVTQPAEQISATQRRLLDAVDQLPTDAQKSLLKFLQSLSKAENKAENTAKNASVDNHEPI